MRRALKLHALALLAIIVLSIVPTALVIGIPTAKAQSYSIKPSSENLNPFKTVELVIDLPGVDVDRVRLRVLDEEGNILADFYAKKIATGRYIAYLGGPFAAEPQFPKVDLSENVSSTIYNYFARLPQTVEPGTTLTVEVLGYDVTYSIPYKPVASSLTLDRATIPVRQDLYDDYVVTLTISDQDLNLDPTAVDILGIELFSIGMELVKRETTGATIEAPVLLKIPDLEVANDTISTTVTGSVIEANLQGSVTATGDYVDGTFQVESSTLVGTLSNINLRLSNTTTVNSYNLTVSANFTIQNSVLVLDSVIISGSGPSNETTTLENVELNFTDTNAWVKIIANITVTTDERGNITDGTIDNYTIVGGRVTDTFSIDIDWVPLEGETATGMDVVVVANVSVADVQVEFDISEGGQVAEPSIEVSPTLVVDSATVLVRETSANSGTFEIRLRVSDILATLNVDRLDKGDLLIIEVASDIGWGDDSRQELRDSKTLDAVYNYPEVSVEFNNQYLVITIKSPDDNIRSGEKDYLLRDVDVEVSADSSSNSFTIPGSEFEETDVNTGVFVYKLNVRWGNDTDIDTVNDVIYLKPGVKSFKVKVTYLDISDEATYETKEPEVTVEKATAAGVRLKIVDADLNNDPERLERLEASITEDGKKIQFAKDGVVLYEVVIKDSAGEVISVGSYSPSFVETDVNSNEFRLMLPADGVFEAGESYIIEIRDLTGDYSKTATVTITGIQVELDRDVYPVSRVDDVKIYVTLYDDSLNEDTLRIDRPEGVVTYYIYNPATNEYFNITSCSWSTNKAEFTLNLTETGPNTGVFEGTITIDEQCVTPKFIGAKIVVYRTGAPEYKDEARFEAYQSSPGDITVDKTVALRNETVVVTIYDPDANVDSKSKDIASIHIYVNDVKKGSEECEETEANSAKFVCEIKVADYAEPGDTIKFVYRDPTPARAPTAVEFGEVEISVSVKVASHTAILEIDKDVILPFEKIKVRVIDPDLNKDASIADEAEVRIAIEGETTIKTLKLTETGINTGVFEGEFSLSWWLGEEVDYKPRSVEEIEERYADYVGKKIMFVYVDDVDETGSRSTITKEIVVGAETATIEVDKTAVNLGETLTITIRNPDTAGLEIPNVRMVLVKSTSYPAGVSLPANEVEPGVYQLKIEVVPPDEWSPGAPQVPAEFGDTIEIIYEDVLNAAGEKESVTKTVTVGIAVEKPMNVTKGIAIDPNTYEPVKAFKVYTRAGFSVTISNVGAVDQSVAVIAVIYDPDGVSVSVQAVKVPVPAGKSVEWMFTFEPKKVGNYTVKIYVVKGLSLAERSVVLSPEPEYTYTIAVTE